MMTENTNISLQVISVIIQSGTLILIATYFNPKSNRRSNKQKFIQEEVSRVRIKYADFTQRMLARKLEKREFIEEFRDIMRDYNFIQKVIAKNLKYEMRIVQVLRKLHINITSSITFDQIHVRTKYMPSPTEEKLIRQTERELNFMTMQFLDKTAS